MKLPGLTPRGIFVKPFLASLQTSPRRMWGENLHPPASSRLREVRRRNSGGNARGIKQSLISHGSIKIYSINARRQFYFA